MHSKYKFYKQLDYMDCGPTCLRMVSAYYGKEYTLDYLRSISHITKNGVSFLGLSEASEKVGFRTLVGKLSYSQLKEEVPLPCILHWNQDHFVVLYDVKEKSLLRREEKLVIGDPGHNLVEVDVETFKKCWVSTDDGRGVALLLETTPEFYTRQAEEEPQENSTSIGFLFQYIKPYKAYLFQIFLGMILASFISMCFPFLTQSLVDFGINKQNLDFVYLVLISQLALFIGSLLVNLIRNWILLHVSTRISITIISNFLIKLMKLPINFFESKNIGDITQRISDHHRIETFLTGSALSTLFSIINLVIFSVVLGIYDMRFLLVFFVGSSLSVAWIFLFLKRRRNIDYNRFQRARENQNSIYEIITGMQEIKLYNSQKSRRWEWEKIQSKLFKVNIKSLALEQYQEIGATFFTQLKNILISFMAAVLVIEGQISLGVMLSISYIIGQMNGPLNQLIQFVKTVQDAKISLERLGEIHNKQNEEKSNVQVTDMQEEEFGHSLNQVFFAKGLNSRFRPGITLDNVSFRYGHAKSALVLKNINLHIPKGQVTAIVGASGSGKTTLMKLLLKFYAPTEGEILVDGSNLNDISAKLWRSQCGTVMQDGYIFSDSIARNIALDGNKIDELKLMNAVHVANAHDYISQLPLGFTTRIGNTGSGLSGGQKQRIFIARAVYKEPSYMFFDEATSALDSNNERIIMENLDEFYIGRTVLIIAHRLSTVKKADQIIVMKDGEIVEQGTHLSLVYQRGYYYELVKNQLELDAA
ncbi:peptidase domain-containing ABC transporter [Pontibacter indicus]|uniref:Bacteriocin-processing peptidase. Cysteine peptidase. MEROPS family C39 n=1 Tax=Pontibacter indicus TaxID=1317125 RepID=A0A1R3XQF4_9BACT|nr:peptidase domain-containing ABC transporter [Pontibacter indicus]SIT93974.1 bacteriocin-processing peptidase. Cysteine peptidase. MEROPS family C39 [Pontibacter indicus]